MIPEQLLDEVKGRFIILYHDDEAALLRLLRQALGKFQAKAGIIKAFQTKNKVLALPLSFLSVVICHDAQGRYVQFLLQDGISKENPTESIQEILLDPKPYNLAPYTVHYFMNLRDWPMDMDLPSECVSLLLDYLEALIEIPNTERQRMSMSSIHANASDLQSVQELKARVSEIEMMMEESRAIIPPVAVY